MKNQFVPSFVFAAITLLGCTSTNEDLINLEKDQGTKLAITTFSQNAPEASYVHKAFLVSENLIEDEKNAASLADLEAFSVQPGNYTIYGIASNNVTNLSFNSFSKSNAITDARIKITDINAQIPEVLVGKSDLVNVDIEGGTANLTMTRIVAALNINVSGLESVEAQNITLTINNMYDQVDPLGTPLKSGADFLSKTITLNKNAQGKYEGNAIVMPTDLNSDKLSLVYNINGTTYTSTPTGRIQANGQYDLKTTVQGGATPTFVQLKSQITYADWNSTIVDLSDSFSLDQDPVNKQWVGPTALAIGGAPSPDNFWASSDAGTTTWGESYTVDNLFNGNKNDGSNYWCPAEWDRTAPSWYIDLGTAKQGVTIDYWNKAGGKGGQKIKDINIYASTNKADYQGGNDNWILITTFSSDKTTATTDAGAHVSTGQIKFSEDGNSSYQYVKCVITSKVDTNNEVNTESIDVNVGEVEVFTWSFE